MDPNQQPPLPEGKVSLKDIPISSNNFVPPVEPPVIPPVVEPPAPVDEPPAPELDENGNPIVSTDELGGDELPVDEPAAADDIQAQLEFFAEVDKVRGQTLQVEYGDILPNSVEGLAIRERAVEQLAFDRYEDDLKRRDPRGAAYLLHRMAGGSDEEFFARKTSVLPDFELFKEDVNLQRQVYKNDLLQKGLGDIQADALIELAVKNNALATEAERSYKQQQAADQQELARLTQVAVNEANQYQAQVQAIDNLLSTTIKSPSLKVVIPDTDQQPFTAYLRNFLQADQEGNFFIAQQVQPETVNQIAEALYIQFKKGDLSAIVTRKANSLNVQRNQLILGKSKKAASSPPPAPAASKKTTLGNLKFS
jgi:hypothetical protein